MVESFKSCSQCQLTLPTSNKYFRLIGANQKRFHSFCRLCEAEKQIPRNKQRTLKSQVIPSYEPRLATKTWKFSHVVLGDIHFPFHSKSALKKAIEYIGDTQPDFVWQVGDLNDQYSHSKYPRSHNEMTPRQEYNEAKFLANEMWRNIQRVSPKSKCRQLRGNHDERITKRILEYAPEAEDFVEDGIDKLYEFPNVLSYKDPQQEVFEDGLCFMHGYMPFGNHAKRNQVSTVVGHSHVGGVLFFTNKSGVFFELNAGCLLDKTRKPFNYRQQKTIDGWTVGLGHIDAYGPRFIPF